MFDNTCKLIAELYSPDFATWLLGKPITLTKLSPTELSIEPIRADALIMLQSDEVVLHIEFQTEPDENMPFRMADYYLRIYRRFPNKQIYQFVIYLDKTTSEKVYQLTFTTGKMRHEFDVIRLWEQPPEIFLLTPGLLPFAVLSATENKASTLQLVAAAVDKISERRTQSNISAAAAILAGLVLDQEVIGRLFRKDIMRESVIYQSILSEGKEEGIELGVRRVAVNLLKENMPVEMVAKVTGLTIEQVQSLVMTDVEQSE
ncbi:MULTISPECIES: Rpn family recombination-promoting nuclease/putative transposase [Nostoc]|uniref:Rpn family recombination-promoting nuclease/putative transposase n=1 Tax=Nostoc paludosum FACHB-159 TaxID=2692908 RepID=A0ABR8KIA0_9NOSO|nr:MULTISPECIES: Rpn family recombination-promoting nuclease/putative transposase [Nostoc]MBD2682385.1 Rpn family recombination-promoting nuclease/putative transposase [Nostoc sp. FACHB-857]MBD2738790.1 Rpn family recombination-promoting nuclease/putative transposase [Nostoc paludosum FACHB-159]